MHPNTDNYLGLPMLILSQTDYDLDVTADESGEQIESEVSAHAAIG